jgi:hypothetical protein
MRSGTGKCSTANDSGVTPNLRIKTAAWSLPSNVLCNNDLKFFLVRG